MIITYNLYIKLYTGTTAIIYVILYNSKKAFLDIYEESDTEMDPLERKIQEYGIKILCENCIWRCTENGKGVVKDLCRVEQIDMDKVVSLEKYLTGWWK